MVWLAGAAAAASAAAVGKTAVANSLAAAWADAVAILMMSSIEWLLGLAMVGVVDMSRDGGGNGK